ncbi:MAG TPA: helix-hairpin-helix domain-containing protein [Candidatus Obscuribacterales bacterium]
MRRSRAAKASPPILPLWWRWHPLRSRLQRDPLARLTSLAEVPVAAALGCRIDVNQATVDDWLRLPGISIHQARTLTSLTQQGVTFHGLEDVAAALGVTRDRLLPLSPLLQFCYYDPASAVAPVAVSINQGTLAQLLRVPGLSAALAERILNERRRSPFTSWADVHQRLRLTAHQTEQWLHWLKL